MVWSTTIGTYVPRRSHILAPLTVLTSPATPWRWTDQHQQAFDEMIRVVTRETLLAYPDFNEVFDIHTDASLYQLGAYPRRESQ